MKSKGQKKKISLPINIIGSPMDNNTWRSIFGCFSSFSGDVKIDLETGKFKFEAAKVVEDFPTRSSINEEVDIVTLNERPKVVYWKQQASNPVSDSSLFDGTFEKQSITVKRVSKQKSEAALNEIALLSRLVQHECVIRYLCHFDDSKFFYLITDNYQTSLEDYMKSFSGRIFASKSTFQQLSSAVEFMHQMNILLMNLNPQNVRVVSVNGGPKLKLANFDVPVDMKTDCTVAVRAFNGMKGFIAPEIKRKQQASFSTDVYALGCLFYYITTDGVQLPQISCVEQKPKLLLKLYHALQAEDKTSDSVLCFQMMRKMLSFISKKRPTIGAVMKFPFFLETHEIFDLILEVAKKLEELDNRKENLAKLEVHKEHIFGDGWKGKIDGEVFDEIVSFSFYDETSVYHLVRAIRNQFAHKRLPKCAQIIGVSDGDLRNYWLGRFPQLIPHLQRFIASFA